MIAKQILAISVLALAASAAMADGSTDTTTPLTRAEVRQQVLAARAAGELLPAGDSADYPLPAKETKSTLTRTEVRVATLDARANGELRDAGEHGDEPYEAIASAPSDLTRAQVVAEVLQARKDGELIPAGDNIDERETPYMAQAKTPKFLSHVYASLTGASR
jgi:hypothetical protein